MLSGALTAGRLRARAAAAAAGVRLLNLHEHHSKALLRRHGVAVQRFGVADTPDEALSAARALGSVREFVVKAAVLAGGRGKGHFDTGYQGGVKLCNTPEEVKAIAHEMLGHRLVTKQTPASGVLVRHVMVAESVDIDKEAYLAMAMDRSSDGPVVIASSRGGMDIEAVAAETPEAMVRRKIDIMTGISYATARDVASRLGFAEQNVEVAAEQIRRLYEVFSKTDSTLVEINPFCQTKDGKIICVDAKFNFDDNAAYRQREIFALRDTAEEDPREVEASKHNLNYVGLDGNIGCLVNGAGLAMSTMDIIKLHGGSPANFLDLGGGAQEGQVVESFRILTSDKNVKAILVNIFGGIVKCDVIASGIVKAAKAVSLKVPLIVRLEGTNMDAARLLLEKSGLPIIQADGLESAAKRAVAALS